MSYNLLEILRFEAAEAKDCAADARTPETARAMFAYMHELLTNAANRIESDAKIFAEHQAAWKANNAFHEDQLDQLKRELSYARAGIR